MKIRHHIYAAAVIGMLATTAYAEDIILGVQGPFTGGSSSMGVSNRAGIKIAVNEINAAGGINGMKIVLVERDDEAKNERGVQIAQEFINNAKVVGVLGFVNTSGFGILSFLSGRKNSCDRDAFRFSGNSTISKRP